MQFTKLPTFFHFESINFERMREEIFISHCEIIRCGYAVWKITIRKKNRSSLHIALQMRYPMRIDRKISSFRLVPTSEYCRAGMANAIAYFDYATHVKYAREKKVFACGFAKDDSSRQICEY